MKSIVVAYDRARGIGANNDLLWGRDLPADLRHFKDITAGGSLIMGRKTFESIGRALPGRENIVVTHRPLDAVDVIAVDSLASAYRLAHDNQFIIGGAGIYGQALSGGGGGFGGVGGVCWGCGGDGRMCGITRSGR